MNYHPDSLPLPEEEDLRPPDNSHVRIPERVKARLLIRHNLDLMAQLKAANAELTLLRVMSGEERHQMHIDKEVLRLKQELANARHANAALARENQELRNQQGYKSKNPVA